jgi:hypothetical protein
MKKWHKVTIGIASAAVLAGFAVFGVITYLERILNPNTVYAVPEMQTVETVDKEAANDFELTRYKFDFRDMKSINGQKVSYNGELTSVALLPQADRTKAINGAIEMPEEAAKALGYIHLRFNEILGGYNAGWFKTEGYGHSAEAAEQAKEGIFDVRLTNDTELYLRLADVIDNEKAAQDLRDVAALVEIGMKNRDVQAYLYAHRVIL